ncbi:hypothetical protein J4Q44_G00085120 [Coregonus suidteri]|uniref:Uncharacterized protein n=1 Tax=Coregonus suidteri TaxID=861788 RepID=A0AAN8MAR0_9TELE
MTKAHALYNTTARGCLVQLRWQLWIGNWRAIGISRIFGVSCGFLLSNTEHPALLWFSRHRQSSVCPARAARHRHGENKHPLPSWSPRAQTQDML